MKKIAILGSTGSIGRQALEVIKNRRDAFCVSALGAGNNVELLIEQIKEFEPEIVSVKSEENANILKKLFPTKKILTDGIVDIAKDANYDEVLVSVNGISGLFPTLEAIKRGKTVALANKETLVTAGDIVMAEARKNNVNIIPVDSEHSAIFQCSNNGKYVSKLIITASGGPFLYKTIDEMRNATKEQTLAHPNWNMGNKITIDSATLMNKGLEVIEAHHLFNKDYDDIKVVIHPQSIVHSAIEFVDGSVIAQMGLPSMHLPIQYALTYPERIEGIKTNSFNFVQARELDFYEPDFEKFSALKIAFDAGRTGGTAPAVLNGANEEAVYAFLDGKIRLTDIADITKEVLEKMKIIQNPTLDNILAADKLARIHAKNLIEQVRV
ncbi:MAG: 1-deoxy-D-xylulose-5-phosphate reductoisomerase [bacterium]|nr:1-deoxy-D-xylulose-5-phosphate reductoisomerase [bacterium]